MVLSEMADVTGRVLSEMLLELEGLFGMLFLLLWRGEMVDDVLGMSLLSQASRRPERRRAYFGVVVVVVVVVVLVLSVRRSSRGGIVI